MKAIIEIDETGLCSLYLRKGEKQVHWIDFTMVEQIRMVNSLSKYHELFSKFIKPEENETK